MGIMARDVALCAILLLQLLTAGLCDQGGRMLIGGPKMELPRRSALSDTDNTNVLRATLVHRDSLDTNTTTWTPGQRFLEAVKRSHLRVVQLQKSLGLNVATKATSLTSPASVGLGDYVMKFNVGTPAKKFSTIIDTGSDLNWIQCLPCTACGQQPDAYFNPAASSTYKLATCTDPLCKALPSHTCSTRNTCTYSYAYGDGSITRGDLAYDTVTLSSAVTHIGLGCGHNQQGSFGVVDGITGLGQGPLSFPSQLSPAIPKIFSYCLVTASTVTSPITFGVAAENSGATYTPLITNPLSETFYYVGVTGITVAGTSVTGIPASAFRLQSNGLGGTILDSGTTITSWTAIILEPVLAVFREKIAYPEVDATDYGLSLCFDVSSGTGDLSSVSMVVHMTNANFKIPALNLFAYVDEAQTTICLAMSTLTNDINIIGNFQQQNNLMVYDVVNKRIGFKAMDCSRLT